jgi:hypothetical protein
MISSIYAPLISPLIDGFALIITILSGYYMYKQKTTLYQSVRTTLLCVYIVSAVLVLLEFVRIELVNSSTHPALLMEIYTELSTSLVLLNALLLGIAAIATYLRPTGTSYKALFLDVVNNHLRHAFVFVIYSFLIVLSDLYLIIFMPYSVSYSTSNLWGIRVPSTTFRIDYLAILLVILVYFLAYPTMLLIMAARKVTNVAIRRSLFILAVCWAGIGLDFMVFDGFVWISGLDANDLMYLVFACVFSITAFIFRKASTLAGFFDTKLHEKPNATVASFPFSKRMGVDSAYLEGKSFLVEIEPSNPYEGMVKDFATEFISQNHLVFVFTSRGSPVYKALMKNPEVKFYILSAEVSYPKPTDVSNEILVPQNDSAVLLDLLSKTVSSTAGTGIGIVFDNISDMILSAGFENCYKFVKQANEIINEPRITTLFLMTYGAHEDRIVRLIKSLFSNHLVDESSGLKITRKL